ncbi:Uma2 family endonuclease [Actinomadura opuntiae]|uniref:Uma2 family endonuclease n=1 Tax=Actinomadura sp. OS1-43 TaxID=604315 RepID=UPI00255A745C|nr:Uma2 family endonuclease [Actinomadura sp. OS1-43]MDL4818152.1 Uma2 family endonuclease [Actinomadura sp. OS1-43]
MSTLATVHHHREFPDTPYNLWMRDELVDLLDLPHDGTRVEIIGGEIVVSPGPDYGHNVIVRSVSEGFLAAKLTDPAFPWRCVQTQDLNLSDIHDGYIPDLCVLSKEDDRQAAAAQLTKVVPPHLALVLEVTSPSTAAHDRLPGLRRAKPTKWNGYARVGIPYYLLVDREPGKALTTLFSSPDTASGEYRESVSWEFGEPIKLPDPFGLEISTDEWEPWQRS